MAHIGTGDGERCAFECASVGFPIAEPYRTAVAQMAQFLVKARKVQGCSLGYVMA
ncbi:hypothetical protein D3C71_1785620 [compost metagenome]